MPTNDSNMEDLQSLNLIRQGGKMRDQGVDALWRKYADPENKTAAFIPKKLIYMSGSKLSMEDAEEIMQETFIKVVRHCESYKSDSPFEAWLWRIAINCMNDHFRRKKARPEDTFDDDGWGGIENSPDGPVAFNPPPSGESLEDCVGRGFAEFAQKFSERAHVLSLVMEGFDTAHIAAAIQRTPGATREFISQSRKRIEEFLMPCREYLSTV